jgi:hypothetical protein
MFQQMDAEANVKAQEDAQKTLALREQREKGQLLLLLMPLLRADCVEQLNGPN